MKKKVFTAFLCLALAILLSACSPVETIRSFIVEKIGKDENAPIATLYTDKSGDQYLGTMNGDAVRLAKEAENVFLTADRKHVVYTQPSGKETEVILQDTKTNEKKEICTLPSGETLYAILPSSRCLLILTGSEKTGSLMVYDMKTNDFPVKLEKFTEGELASFQMAAYEGSGVSASFGYVRDKAIYTFREGDKEATKLYTVSAAEPELLYLSANCDTVVWSETSGKVVTLRMAYRDKVTVAVRDLGLDDEILINGTLDGGFTAIYAGNHLRMFRKNEQIASMKSIYESVGLDDVVYTDGGLLTSTAGSAVKGIYLEMDEALWYVDTDGGKKKILSNLDRYVIRKNKIYYIQNNVFYMADIKNGEATDRLKIGSEVLDFAVSQDGKFAYFINVYDTLYAFRYGEQIANRVASDVAAYYVTTTSGCVLYLIEKKQVSGESEPTSYIGTLMRYDCKKDASRTVAYDVSILSLNSGMKLDGDGYSYIDISSFEFLEYAGTDNGRTVYDLRYHSAKKMETVAENVRP